MDALDWIGQVVSHIPDPGDQMVRYYFVWISRAIFDDLVPMNITPEKLVHIPNGVERPKFNRNRADHDKIVFVDSGSLTAKKIVISRFGRAGRHAN